MIKYAFKYWQKLKITARAWRIPFWVMAMTGSHQGQKPHLWCGISCGSGGKGAMNASVSKLPQNKKEPGFPVGGPRSEWCPGPHTPTGLNTDRKQDLPTNHRYSAPVPGDRHFCCCQIQTKLRNKHWAQALNIKMASGSEPQDIHSVLQNSLPCHPLPCTPQYSMQP